VPAFLLLELACAAAPHPDHDAEEDGDRGQADSLGHYAGIDEHSPGRGDDHRGGHDPLPAAERHSLTFTSDVGGATDYYFVAGASADEQAQLFHRTAERIYRVPAA